MTPEQLQDFLTKYNLSAASCARMCSKTPNTFSRYFSGKLTVIPEEVATICTAYSSAMDFIRHMHALANRANTLRHKGRSSAAKAGN